MKKYEIMFIIKPNIEEAEIKKIEKSLAKILEENKAKIVEKKEYGQKEIAYEINKHKMGYYFLYLVETDNIKAIEEFDRQIKINENIIRHMIIKKEK